MKKFRDEDVRRKPITIAHLERSGELEEKQSYFGGIGQIYHAEICHGIG